MTTSTRGEYNETASMDDDYLSTCTGSMRTVESICTAGSESMDRNLLTLMLRWLVTRFSSRRVYNDDDLLSCAPGGAQRGEKCVL